jgi:hypothetical protein
MSFFMDRIWPIVWGVSGPFAGLMLGDTPMFFDCAEVWCSYVVLPR